MRFDFQKLWLLPLAVFISTQVFNDSAWAKKQDDKVCAARFREIKDCHLLIGAFPIHLWKDKIILRGPVERSMTEIQVQPALEWDLARGHFLGKKALLELVIWTPAASPVELESAVLLLYEISRGKIEKKLEKIVQRRKMLTEDKEVKVGSAKKYEMDKRAKFILLEKNNKVHWSLGKESGVL